MIPRRYAARRDANEVEIVRALEAIGCSVLRVDAVDLIVGRAGVNYLIECKDGRKSAGNRPLTPAQKKLRAEWRGQYAVVTSVDEALAVVAGRAA